MMVNFPRTRMKTITPFLTGYVRSFYKGGFVDLLLMSLK
jgi:hypothetical protein